MLEQLFLLWPSELLGHVNFAVWLFLFLHAGLLTYQLFRIRKWNISLISFCIFAVVQALVFASEMHLMSRPDYDDSAGSMLVPFFLILPSVLLIVLTSLSGLIWMSAFLTKKIKERI